MNDAVYTGLSSGLSAGQGQTEIGYVNVARTVSSKQVSLIHLNEITTEEIQDCQAHHPE